MNQLQNPEIRFYLEFLSVFLEMINTLNVYFQQSGSCVIEILPKNKVLLIIMMNLIINRTSKKLSFEEKLGALSPFFSVDIFGVFMMAKQE